MYRIIRRLRAKWRLGLRGVGFGAVAELGFQLVENHCRVIGTGSLEELAAGNQANRRAGCAEAHADAALDVDVDLPCPDPILQARRQLEATARRARRLVETETAVDANQ